MHQNMSQSVTNVYNMIHKRKHNDIVFVYIVCDTLTHTNKKNFLLIVSENYKHFPV